MFLSVLILHGVWDFSLYNFSPSTSLIPFISGAILITLFYIGTKSLYPLIQNEEDYRKQLREKSKISIEEHWLRRIEKKT